MRLVSALFFLSLMLAATSCQHGQTRTETSVPDSQMPVSDTTLLFFFSRGCDDCHKLLPALRQYIARHAAIVFQPLDVDSLGWTHELIETYAIERVPTVVLLAPQGGIISSVELENVLHGLEDAPDNAALQ